MKSREAFVVNRLNHIKAINMINMNKQVKLLYVLLHDGNSVDIVYLLLCWYERRFLL